MSSELRAKCHGCGAGLGEKHSKECTQAICWHCGHPCIVCGCPRLGDYPYPWTGDLECVFADENRRYVGMDFDEFQFWPHYKAGKLVGLRVNRVGPGPWRVIETSSQARGVTELTMPMPHLCMLTADDCVEALLDSPVLPRLQVLQLGETRLGWDGWLGDDEAPCEGERSDALARLVERMRRVRTLRLAALTPEPNKVLAAAFPPLLETLLVRTLRPFDLSVLARNDSLGRLKSLVLHQERLGDDAGGKIAAQFGSLVNSPGLDGVQEELYIHMLHIDDKCCKALAASRMLKHLQRVALWGKGLTDAGLAVLAASPEVRAMGKVAVGGPNVTEQGRAALRAAGVPVIEGWN